MRRLFHLLLLAAVLWCGSDLSPAEATMAHDGPGCEQRLVDTTAPDPHDDRDPRHASHGGHAHCPVAVEDRRVAIAAPVAANPVHFVPAAPALTSLTRAPPIQPPAA